VLESFKGRLRDQVTLSLGPSSEEFSYVKGQRVLVYARRLGTEWSTACLGTRQVSPEDEGVVVLRGLRAPQEDGGVIEGTVATPQRLRTRPARNIRVVVRRGSTVVAELQTDDGGRFQTGWLSPGTYGLSTEVNDQRGTARREVVVSRRARCISVTLNGPLVSQND